MSTCNTVYGTFALVVIVSAFRCPCDIRMCIYLVLTLDQLLTCKTAPCCLYTEYDGSGGKIVQSNRLSSCSPVAVTGFKHTGTGCAAGGALAVSGQFPVCQHIPVTTNQ